MILNEYFSTTIYKELRGRYLFMGHALADLTFLDYENMNDLLYFRIILKHSTVLTCYTK